MQRVLRIGDLVGPGGITGLKSRSSIYKLMAEGKFPRPIKLSGPNGPVAWLENEVMAWIDDRAAARDAVGSRPPADNGATAPMA